MIFCPSLNMTSLNTFFSFFNMPADEFVKRYRKYMLKYNVKEMEDENGIADYDEIRQKYLLSDIEYNASEGNIDELSEGEAYICVCTVKDLYFLYTQYKNDFLHLSYEDFELYLDMYEDEKIEIIPYGKIHTFGGITNFMFSDDDSEIRSKSRYYSIDIYYNHKSKKYEYVE